MKKAIIKRAAVGMLASALLCAAAIPASAASAATQQGVDISHYDGAVDFNALKTSGHGDFAYIKATEGEGYTDSWFTRNSQSASASGVPWGPYHFFRAYSVASAQTQADHFWQTIKGTGYSLRPVVDVETADGQQRAADVRAILQAFCDRFRQLSGEQPVIYSYTSYINEYSLAKQFGGYLLWQAQYGPMRAGTGWDAQVWQYSDKGSVAGVTAPTVDLNVLYDTSVYESGQTTAAPAVPIQSPPQESSDYYPVAGLPQVPNSRAGVDFYIRDRYGNRIGNHQIDAGDPLIILGVNYDTQLAEVLYPNYAAHTWCHGHITNNEAQLHNTGYNAWDNGHTSEPVYDATGARIGAIYPREKATVLERGNMTKVLYSTDKGGESKSGFVRYPGR